MDINYIINFIASGALWGILIAFFILSYLIFALLNWSLKKPIKWIGIGSIIVGVLLIAVRILGPVLVEMLISDIKIPGALIAAVLKPILIAGIIYIVIGIGLLVLSKLIKSKDTKKVNSKQKKDIK